MIATVQCIASVAAAATVHCIATLFMTKIRNKAITNHKPSRFSKEKQRGSSKE